jgi:hypothetical protein
MEDMARATNVSMSKLLLASMAAGASRRAVALAFNPTQSRASDGKFGSGSGRTSTGHARGSLARRVAIAKPKAAYQKAKAAHGATPTPQTKAKLDAAAARLKVARHEAAAKYAGGNPDATIPKRAGTADERRAALHPVKAQYERAKSDHEKHGTADSKSRLDVAHARLTEARTGKRPVDSSTWGERANFNDILKAQPSEAHSDGYYLHGQVVDQLMQRQARAGDAAGARKTAREYTRHRTSTDTIGKAFDGGEPKTLVREGIDAELDSMHERMRDHASGSKAGKTLADHEYRLAKAEAYARLEAVHQTRKQTRKRNA